MIPLEFTSPLLHELIIACWHRDPRKRIPFTEVVCRLQRLRVIAGDGCDPTGTFDEAESWPASPYLSGSSIASPLSEILRFENFIPLLTSPIHRSPGFTNLQRQL